MRPHVTGRVTRTQAVSCCFSRVLSKELQEKQHSGDLNLHSDGILLPQVAAKSHCATIRYGMQASQVVAQSTVLHASLSTSRFCEL